MLWPWIWCSNKAQKLCPSFSGTAHGTVLLTISQVTTSHDLGDLKLLLDLGKYYPQRGNLDGAKFKLLIMKFGP